VASQFGPIVAGAEVEDAALLTLRTYLPSYLAEVAGQAGLERDALPAPRSWVTSSDQTKWAEHQLPALVVVCPGLYDTPVKQEKNIYEATWSVGVFVLVSSTTKAATRRLMHRYIAAVRTCLKQLPTLPYLAENPDDPDGPAIYTPGIADKVEWLDEDYDVTPDSASRTLLAGQINLAITVKDVLDVSMGIRYPSVDPVPEVLVSSTHIEVRKAQG
jgi:hypothetical protein